MQDILFFFQTKSQHKVISMRRHASNFFFYIIIAYLDGICAPLINHKNV